MLGESVSKSAASSDCPISADKSSPSMQTTITLANASNHSPAGCGIHTFPKQPGVASGSLTDP